MGKPNTLQWQRFSVCQQPPTSQPFLARHRAIPLYNKKNSIARVFFNKKYLFYKDGTSTQSSPSSGNAPPSVTPELLSESSGLSVLGVSSVPSSLESSTLSLGLLLSSLSVSSWSVGLSSVISFSLESFVFGSSLLTLSLDWQPTIPNNIKNKNNTNNFFTKSPP